MGKILPSIKNERGVRLLQFRSRVLHCSRDGDVARKDDSLRLALPAKGAANKSSLPAAAAAAAERASERNHRQTRNVAAAGDGGGGGGGS